MRSSWGILAAVSGHLAGRQASAAPGHHSLPVRTLQTLAQREPVRLKKLSAPDNGILELTLERPEVKNAISWELMTRLRGAIHKIEADATAKVVLVASSVPGVFCAGADLKALSIPTIAVIEGAALGGGLELALSCDLRICGENATLGLPETGLAIIPGAGGTQRLPRIIGRSRAKELIFTGRRCDATEAVLMGLANYRVPAGEAYGKALELAREMTKKERRLMGPSEVREFVNTLRATFSSFEALPIPTIAVVEGAAFGGGLELALSCDLRICGIAFILQCSSFIHLIETSFGPSFQTVECISSTCFAGESATFSLPETGLAIIPGAGGTQRLPRIVGRARAKELIFTGRRFDATEAVNMGVVNYCVPGGEAYQKALELAREINQKGPLAIRMAKKAINEGMEVDLSSALAVEEGCYEQVLHTQDRLEGLAAFAEKRKPLYTGK
ncbi:probable enoyl-CoA hydratase 2, mitochondrial isoform X2 [Triticum aestivum]|uniref:probable enoyl-CoA hydratase 2, mitochondrial isoform X2 n=1 Tax=Triticum aestivum TaxID=4565 RepID=UPI001D01EE76|nr:probable enoyl-CoA hydratase 2, mitochondrial isoform X2 [Triticum aestivum]